MKPRDKLILAGLGTLIVSYLFGAWMLLLGFIMGYYGLKALYQGIAGGFGEVLLVGFTASAVCSSYGFFAGFCYLLSWGGLIVSILPLFIVGAIEALAGGYLGGWVKKT